MYRKLDVLPLDTLKELEWGKIMYKFQNKVLPKAFDHYFKKPRHHYEEDYGLLIHSATLKETNKNMIKAVHNNYE